MTPSEPPHVPARQPFREVRRTGGRRVGGKEGWGLTGQGRGLTVQLYLTQSSQKRLAENFLRRTTVSP